MRGPHFERPSRSVASLDSGRPTHGAILVVEDEAFVRFALAEWLRGEGYEVIEAASGDEAATVVSSRSIDLIITDVQMPGSLNGLQLARHIRSAFPSLPVIVVSGHARPENFDEIGAAAFFLKPYDFNELTARVAALTPGACAPVIRAVTSTRHATCLPISAARISESRSGVSARRDRRSS